MFIVAVATVAVASSSSSLLEMENKDNNNASQSYQHQPLRPRRQQQRHQQRKQRRRMQVAPLNVYLLVKDEFDKRRRSIEDFVFQSFDAFSTTTTTNSYSNDNDEDSVNNNNNKKTSPSRLYTYTAFFESLRTISVDGILGQSYHIESNPYIPGYINADDSFVQEDSNMAFYLSQDDTDDDTDTVASNNAIKYAIVNVCAFLANAMAEAIQFDACEELNGIAFDTSSSSSSSSSGGLLSELSGVNGRYVVTIILNLK